MTETNAQFLERMFQKEAAARRRRIQAALARARAFGGAKAAQPTRKGEFHVASSSGRGGYTVVVASIESMLCTCPAGGHHQPCWHQAAVFLRLAADSAVAPRYVVRHDPSVDRFAPFVVFDTTTGQPAPARNRYSRPACSRSRDLAEAEARQWNDAQVAA